MMMAGMGMAGLQGAATGSPRMTKPNGVPNGGQGGMSASVANGMAAAAAAAGMAGMPPAMAAAMHMPPQQAAMLQGMLSFLVSKFMMYLHSCVMHLLLQHK